MERLVKKYLITIIVILSLPVILFSQYPVNYQYTLLPERITDMIIGASSGDLAMQHIYELAGYVRPRTDTEYSGYPDETKYIIKKLSQYGLSGIKVEKFGKEKSWRGLEGSLWEISPGTSKIADFNDLPAMLAEGSLSSDVTTQLIWVGEGQPSYFEDNAATIKGKIVFTSGSPGRVHSLAMKAGALGVVSYYSPRPLVDPIQIPDVSIRSSGGFAFMVPPREAQYLRDRLLRHENITVKARVRSEFEESDLHVVECVIPGKDTTAGEIILTAHLYEGLVKMGANDNASGSAVLLEVAHLLSSLINDGMIDKPERNIRLLWVPEFSGTIPWVNAHKDQVKKALCNVNLDMVGLRLRESKSFMSLYRSGFSNTGFVNDVMESYFRFTGETNTEGITDELGRRGFSKTIISPTGSDDPFYYKIYSLHGSSDNAVFNDWSIGVSGVKMGTWPDNFYHTSEDSPDKCDPTQLRRVIFITASGAYTMAAGGEETALRVLSEMYAGATRRMGFQLGKASDMIMNADAKILKSVYKRTAYNIEGCILAEKSAIEKVRLLSVGTEVVSMINSRKQKLDNLLELNLIALGELMTTRSKELSIPPAGLAPGGKERDAMKTIPVPTEKARKMDFAGYNGMINALPEVLRNSNPFLNIVNISEAAGLADGKRNLLQIKKMLDAQFERESPLEDIGNYYALLKEAGLMKY